MLVVDASALLLEGEERFDQAIGNWALVGRAPEAQELGGAWAFRTRANAGENDGEGPPVLLSFDHVILPLRKRRTDGPFSHVILIGRASSNDVQLTHTSTSKLHARVEVIPGADHVVVADAGSSNGTTINDEMLGHGERRRAASGARLLFGTCAFVLLDSPSLKTLLRSTGPALAVMSESS